MAKISVIIPCYNSEKYLSKCIDALRAQTYKDFDVIMIDDCSADGTWEVISELEKDGELTVKALKNRVNLGPSKTRSFGIRHSEAEYISFCDSDDRYDETFLQKMITAAEGNDADIVFCNTQKVLSNGKIIKGDLIGDAEKEITVKKALSFGFDSMCAMMIKREIVANTPFPDLRNGEDMAMIPLMIMKAQQFGVVKDCIYNYYCRQASLSLIADESAVSNLEASFDFIYENRCAEYEREIEFIGIKNVVYGALMNLFKFSFDTKRAKSILVDFEKRFPKWESNLYIKTLPIYKRLFLFFAMKRLFVFTKLISSLHKVVTK